MMNNELNIPTESNNINCLRGEFSFLSNFYRRKLFYNGILFPSAEHAFQGSKGDREFQYNISKIEKPIDAKKEGNLTNITDDWVDKNINIMYEILCSKFSLGNKDLREKLVNTNYKFIIEENIWHDNYWGNCTCEKCKNIKGRNILGQLLMLIRDNIKFINNLKKDII